MTVSRAERRSITAASIRVLKSACLGAALAVLVPFSPVALHAQDVLWVGRIGTDTAVVESVRQTATGISGTIVNVAAGLLVQRYEVELDARGNVRALRSWNLQDLSSPPGADSPPSVVVEIDDDSIHATTSGPGGTQTVAAATVPGAVPIFDAFFNNPMSLMDLALQQAIARGDGEARLYFVGSAVVERLPLTGDGQTGWAFPYVLARSYPMLAGAQLHATMEAGRMKEFDAGETTFKILTDRYPWTDGLALARSFSERGLGAGGFSTMSPPRRASGRIGNVDIAITYGQPSKRGRRIFPDVVPFGSVWRAGANAATEITFSADVEVGGTPVPAGSYSLWVLPGERADTLIISKATRIWGVMYDATQDHARVPLQRATPPIAVEALTYRIIDADGGGRLELAWDDRVFSVVIEPTGRLADRRTEG